MAAEQDKTLPLEGVRALEVAEVWAGPFCGTLLADLGAEVIKVESVQRIYRGALRPRPDTPGYPEGGPGERPWNRVANFNAVNRNKLGITLDLSDPEGVEVFKRLARVSDVVFSNYVYGVMESFGLGYEALRQMKPDLIVVTMPGYGNTGPYKRYRSMGMTIDAITGHSALRGYPDLDLTHLTMVHHPDAVAGATAAFAICAALHYRARTGKGQLIDLSQAEAFMPHMGEIFLEYAMTGRDRERRGNKHPAMAPHGCYPCSGEDNWVTIAVRDETEWRAFCGALGEPELADDARFATLEARLRNQAALDEIISRWTATRDRYEVMRLIQARGIPSGVVLNSGPDTYDDPHLQARGYFETVAHPEAGTHLLSGSVWKFREARQPPQRPAPTLGQHNADILGELLGLSEDYLKELAARDIIGTTPLEGADMGGVRRHRG